MLISRKVGRTQPAGQSAPLLVSELSEVESVDCEFESLVAAVESLIVEVDPVAVALDAAETSSDVVVSFDEASEPELAVVDESSGKLELSPHVGTVAAIVHITKALGKECAECRIREC